MTITIQIGNTDNKLTQQEWSDFVGCVSKEITSVDAQVHFFGASAGWLHYQNAAWVIDTSPNESLKLLHSLVKIRKLYQQDSIAWTEGNTTFI